MPAAGDRPKLVLPVGFCSRGPEQGVAALEASPALREGGGAAAKPQVSWPEVGLCAHRAILRARPTCCCGHARTCAQIRIRRPRPGGGDQRDGAGCGPRPGDVAVNSSSLGDMEHSLCPGRVQAESRPEGPRGPRCRAGPGRVHDLGCVSGVSGALSSAEEIPLEPPGRRWLHPTPTSTPATVPLFPEGHRQ